MISLIAALLCGVVAAASNAPAPRVAVVAELFTSEGCSSCPPADDLLRRLVEEQPIDGVEVIGLSEHVDYWDHQGWRDPFSSPHFTERQREYAQALGGEDRIYTPQLVIDGGDEMVGSDADRVRSALVKAAAARHAVLAVTAVRTGGALDVRVDITGAPEGTEDLDVVLALVEDGLVSDVKRGENARRTLRHSSVTRRLQVAGSLPRGAAGGSFTRKVALDPKWTMANVRVITFLQQRRSRRIYGAASSPIR